MSANKFPMRTALLVAALMQCLPMLAEAAAKSDADDTHKICEDCPDNSGRTGWVQGGIGIQSDDSAHFGRYTGRQDSGATLDLSGEVRYRNNDGTYYDGKAIDLGLDSRDLAVDYGKQGKYGVGVEYDQIPNYREKDAGATLKTQRDRSSINFSYVPTKDWELTGRYQHEQKDGTKDVGASFGLDSINIPQILPVDFKYQTDDINLAMGYKGSKLQAEFAYAGSFFSNDHKSIIWNNASSAIPNQGSLAEAPNNASHQLSALLGYQLSDHTRLGGQFSVGRMTQNESYLPYTVNPGISTLALPATSLDGKVDTTQAKVEVNSRPSPRVRLDASYTYSDRDNKTPVNTYQNVITDAALWTDPSTGLPVTRQNRPYSYKQNLLRLKAGYRLDHDADVSAGFDYDGMNRTYQPVKDTKDKTAWAKFSLHPAELMDASFKYSYSTRSASSYVVPTSYDPGYPPSVNPLMQAFELADRNRDKIGMQLAYTPRDTVTLGLDLDYYRDDYKNMALGLTKASGLTVTPTVTYSFSEAVSGAVYYTYEKLESNQNGREWVQSGIPPTTTVIWDVAWLESDSNLTQTVGVNATWKAIPKKLDITADAVYSDFTGQMHYANATNLPDLSSTLTALGVHGVYKMKDNLSVRAGIWYERYKQSDWAKINSIPTVITLGATPQNADTTLVSVSARYEFK